MINLGEPVVSGIQAGQHVQKPAWTGELLRAHDSVFPAIHLAPHGVQYSERGKGN